MKYKQWNVHQAGTLTARRKMEQSGLPSLCAAVLCARGLDTPEKARAFLSSDIHRLHDPFLLPDMERAVRRIQQALHSQEIIAVYGDYDVDGITSTCLLTEFLRRLGGHVITYIPGRLEEGYGLNQSAIDSLHLQSVSLIITVDCGITASSEVEHAKSLGIDVVITDHHNCIDTLPDACAVVDPFREDSQYPFLHLAGVGVALKVILAMTPLDQRDKVFMRYADLAALGTVADVMQLSGENRTIVEIGLDLLTRTRRPGLQSLIREVYPKLGRMTTDHIGYGLAPRLNAAGRMGHAEIALNLLMTQDSTLGMQLADELCSLNRERQALEMDIFEECMNYLNRNPNLTKPAIVLAGEGWHQGVVGIVASKLAEKFSCPVFMICLDHGKGKGSCRSFGGFNLFDALEFCSPFLENYGGHELAAGFTILEQNIPAFQQTINRLVLRYTSGTQMVSSVDVDVEIEDSSFLTCEQVDALSRLEPFGTGNPKPIFQLQGATVISCSDVGGGRHMKMKLRWDGHIFDSIFFSMTCSDCGVSPYDRLDLVFSLNVNEFRGRRDVQLQLIDLRSALTRAQLEFQLYDKFCTDVPLTAREAAILLPERTDFANLWRYFQHSCSSGPISDSMDHLIRSALRSVPGTPSYGKALVCLRVMHERGLIRITEDSQQLSVSILNPEEKVDLEQSAWMKKLRAFLEPGP